MALEFRIVIPARYAAQRLPGKPLREIDGRPMIEWVYRAALMAEPSEVVVATDDARIHDAVCAFGGNCCMTGAGHQSGSDRIVEVIEKNAWPEQTIIVNLQGDEPLMPAQNIRQVAQNLAASDCAMATLYKAVDAAAARDPNLVKLVRNNAGRALYFSRAAIPYDRNRREIEYLGHIGIYAYRAEFLKTFTRLEASALELAESLEQLRALDNGYSIHCAEAQALPGPGIDTEDDLERVREIMASAKS